MIENGMQAFPSYRLEENFPVMNGGMTLRDYFAGQALAGMQFPVEYLGISETKRSYSEHCRKAYTIADAMIAERNKQND